MRGTDERSGSLFSYVDLEMRVPTEHPLRAIRDYAANVMADSETHLLFSERLAADPPMRREIAALNASLSSENQPLSPMMQDLLAAVEGLSAGSHTNLREIADLAAVQLVYKLRETE
jgi:hypothetical protein